MEEYWILNYLSCSKENDIRVNSIYFSPFFFFFFLLVLRASLRKKARPAREPNNIGGESVSVRVIYRHKFQTVKPQIAFRLRFPVRTINSRVAFSEDVDPSIGSMDASNMGREKKSPICDAIFPAKFLADRAETSTPFRVWNWGKKRRSEFSRHENRRMKRSKIIEIFGNEWIWR